MEPSRSDPVGGYEEPDFTLNGMIGTDGFEQLSVMI